MGGFGPGGSVPNPEKTWLRTSTHGDEYDREIEAMIDEMEGNVQNETVASQVGGVDGDDDDGVHVMDCEVDDDDGGGGTCVGMCTLRGVSVTPVPSYIYVGHAMDYFKDADKLPGNQLLWEEAASQREACRRIICTAWYARTRCLAFSMHLTAEIGRARGVDGRAGEDDEDA
jgi:hypothetical protein